MTLRFYCFILLSALTFTCVSCATKVSDTCGQVDGIVRIDSQSLANAEVYFAPIAEGSFASGIANELGEFQLRTAGKNSSVDIPVGQYRVFFNHEGIASPDVLDENGAIVSPATTYCDVPVKYTNPETSGLIVEVAKGANFFNFNLQTEESRDEAKN
ncbi:MAG: hypothetical protein ACI4NP_06020 [Thermoguttaceae bacterium]